MSQTWSQVISFSVIQNKYSCFWTGADKPFSLQQGCISESHLTTAVYICSSKSRLENLLLFSSFEMYHCTEQQMLDKKQNVSQEAYNHGKLQKRLHYSIIYHSSAEFWHLQKALGLPENYHLLGIQIILILNSCGERGWHIESLQGWMCTCG